MGPPSRHAGAGNSSFLTFKRNQFPTKWSIVKLGSAVTWWQADELVYRDCPANFKVFAAFRFLLSIASLNSSAFHDLRLTKGGNNLTLLWKGGNNRAINFISLHSVATIIAVYTTGMLICSPCFVSRFTVLVLNCYTRKTGMKFTRFWITATPQQPYLAPLR